MPELNILYGNQATLPEYRLAKVHLTEKSHAMEDQATNELTSPAPAATPVNPVAASTKQLFQRCLIDNIREGVVMVDEHLKVKLWNQAAEQLTGIRGPGMLGSEWLPSYIDLRDRFDQTIPDSACPIKESMRKAEQVMLAATVTGRGGRRMAIEMHVIPVMGRDTSVRGAVILMHDQSSQVDLEQQVLTLYAHATRDQLTGVANRAHFERSLDARIKEFNSKSTISSLIVADIDFFKKINDDFGHHTGDQALISFAKILQDNTRSNDLVARYGGEEFVIVCPNCSLEIAVERAEEIRYALSQAPISALNGKHMTASFGVTEFQTGDTAVTAFVRADQALLLAKENGRNQVRYLMPEKGKAAQEPSTPRQIESEIQWSDFKGLILQQQEGEFNCPMEILIEKIKGIVLHDEYKIAFSEEGYLRILVNKKPGEKRGLMSRPTNLIVDIESRENIPSFHNKGKCIRLRITVRTTKNRERRQKDLEQRAKGIMLQFLEHLAVTKISNKKIADPASRY